LARSLRVSAQTPPQISAGAEQAQEPPLQVSAPAQARPQPPQLVRVPHRSASQSWETSPSQSPQPGSQAARPQALVEQVPSRWFAPGQALPQVPQLATLESRSVSQPFAAFPSQLPQPVAHAATPHVPPVHPAVPWATAGQVLPQVPQLAAVVTRSVSHPLTALPSQFPQPAVHVAMPHAPPVHPAVPWATAGQVLPHVPQLAAAVSRFVSQPLAALPSQLPQPVAHAAIPHVPPVHPAVPWATAGQVLPQVPQLVAVVSRSVSQPFAALPSQLPQPTEHVAMPHVPAEQAPVPWEMPRQTIPHVPQLVGLVSRSVSQPLATRPSQSAQPASQAAAPQRPTEQLAVP
jgi:hypothetical protein